LIAYTYYIAHKISTIEIDFQYHLEILADPISKFPKNKNAKNGKSIFGFGL